MTRKRRKRSKEQSWTKGKWPSEMDPDDAILVRDVFPPDRNPKKRKYGE
jgi:hypothetical protein